MSIQVVGNPVNAMINKQANPPRTGKIIRNELARLI
jgi:hypothetical protein